MALPLPTKPASGSIINASEGLSSGLVRAILYNEGSGSPKELVGGAFGTLNGSPTWATDADLGGTCLDTSGGATKGINWGANGLSYGNSHMSVFWVGRIPTIAARQHAAGEAAGGATNGVFWGLNDTGAMQFVIADVVALDSGIGPLTVGDVYSVGVAWTVGTGVLFHARNHTTGATVTDSVGSAATATTSSNPSATSNRRDFGIAFDSRKVLDYMWNRALVAADFVNMHDNIYRVISSNTRSDGLIVIRKS